MEALPDCPEWMTEPAKLEWQRVLPELAKAGRLATLDRAALAAYCQCFAHWQAAEQFLAEGGYYWNAGIFVWRAAAVLEELRRNKPALVDGIKKIADAWPTPNRDRVLREVVIAGWVEGPCARDAARGERRDGEGRGGVSARGHRCFHLS